MIDITHLSIWLLYNYSLVNTGYLHYIEGEGRWREGHREKTH